VDQFIQLTVDALTLGSVYALIALGYTLVYGVLKLLNFAHGDVFMVGSFIGFGMLQLLGGTSNPVVPVWLLLVLITAAAMGGCAVLGVAIERFAYRPLRDAPRIAPLISALGVSFFLANSMQLLFGAAPRNYDTFDIHNAVLYTSGFNIGNVHVPLLRVITIAAALIRLLFSPLPNFFDDWIGGLVAHSLTIPFAAAALTTAYFKLTASETAATPPPAEPAAADTPPAG